MRTLSPNTLALGAAALVAAAVVILPAPREQGAPPTKAYIVLTWDDELQRLVGHQERRRPKDAIPLARMTRKSGYKTHGYMDPTGDGWQVSDGTHTKHLMQSWVATNEAGRMIGLDVTGLSVTTERPAED